MGDPDGTTSHGERAAAALDKGKGRAIDNAQPEDVSMGEDEESSSDESIVDDHVCCSEPCSHRPLACSYRDNPCASHRMANSWRVSSLPKVKYPLDKTLILSALRERQK